MTPHDLHSVRADDPLIAVLREKTPAERLAIAHGMWSHARKLIETILRAEHPDWSPAMINREAARRISHGSV
jgi:2-keto-3-deoxy-6-phosphogluconate aldolase